MEFRRNYNPEYTGTKGFITTKPSMTQPDQTLSIRTLLNNHTRGIPDDTQMQKGEYYDTDIPNIQDLNDVAEYREKLAEEEQILKKTASKELKEAKEKRDQEAIDAAKIKLQEEKTLESSPKQQT